MTQPKLKDYNCCPRCGSKLVILIGPLKDVDTCLCCGWHSVVDMPSPAPEMSMLDCIPGTVLEGWRGSYERTEEGDWICQETGQVLTDGELAAEERNLLNGPR